MVLFCKSMYAELQMAIFAGTERLTFLDIQREQGNIFDLVARAEKYIASNIRWRVEFDGSLQRREIPEIPMDAIREALINSFCHKDYGACQSNEVAIYKDRVEIYNPGTFPEGYQPEDFIKGEERPIRRNPLITSVLYYSKDVESFGTGLKRISEACATAGCKVDFKILKSGFVVAFYRDIGTYLFQEDTRKTQVSDQVSDQVDDQVKDRAMREKILELCSTSRSKTDLCKILGYKNKTYFTRQYIVPLLASGQLRMTIPDKPNGRNQRYVTVKKEAGDREQLKP